MWGRWAPVLAHAHALATGVKASTGKGGEVNMNPDSGGGAQGGGAREKKMHPTLLGSPLKPRGGTKEATQAKAGLLIRKRKIVARPQPAWPLRSGQWA